MVKAPPRQEKLNRIGQQLALTEQMLQNHPLTQDKWGIVVLNLHFLSLQTRWISSGPMARFLIALQAGLLGVETGKSETGFIGPNLLKCQQGLAKIVSALLPREALGLIDMLMAGIQVITLLGVHVISQFLGNWKGMFPQRDKVAAERAGNLYQELGMIWLFGTKSIDLLFSVLTKGLNIEEKYQQKINQLALLYMVLITIPLLESGNKLKEEMLETLQLFIKEGLKPVEELLEQALSRGVISDEMARLGVNQVQLFNSVIEKNEPQELLRILRELFERCGIPYDGLKQDLRKLTEICAQLSNIFSNIFFQTDQLVPTVDQAA